MKRKIILATLFALLLIPVVIAQPNKALKCDCPIMFDVEQWAWVGTITIPDGETYDIIFYADTDPRFVGHPTEEGALFPRHLEQFEETWEIYDGETLLASGYDTGIFSSDSWKYNTVGKVEAAYGELAYLDGANVLGKGVAWIEEGIFYGEGVCTFAGYAGK